MVASRGLRSLSFAAAGWALLYALYRGYYGIGGTAAMIGVPASESTWRAINLVAAGLLLVAAVLPIGALRLWGDRRLRPLLLAASWVIAVGCLMHAIVDDAQRVLSLAGLVELHYPADVWLSVDRRAADLQDLLFNETWFIVEGLLWAALAWTVMGPSTGRWWWVATATAAVAVLTVIGLASAFGVIGRAVVG